MVAKPKETKSTDTSTKSKATKSPPKSPVRSRGSGKPRSPGRSNSPRRQKSPARPKSPSRQKSPARRNSPARTKSSAEATSPRPKSPSRQASKSTRPKSPARKSPVRTTPNRSKVDPPKKTYEKEKILTVDLDSDSDIETLDQKLEKPKAAIRGRSRLDIDSYEKEIEDVKDVISSYKIPTLSRRSARLQNEERVVHLNNYEPFTKLTEFSDDDDAINKKTNATETLLETKKESTGRNIKRKLTALSAVVFVPFLYVFLHAICNENHCSFVKLPNLKEYKKLSVFFDLVSFLVVIGYALILAIFSAIPFGGRKVTGVANKQGKLEYVMNGFLTAFILVGAVAGLEVYGIPATHFLRTKFLQLSVAATIFGIAVSVLLYVRSFYVPISSLNPNAVTNDNLHNFVVGRETNPRIFGVLDMKMFFNRYAVVGILIINTLFIMDSLIVKNAVGVSMKEPIAAIKALNVNPTFMTIALMQTVYMLDALIFEHTIVTSFENQYEGLGFIFSLTYSYGPFVYTCVTKYVLDHNVKLSTIQLCLLVIPYIIGYILYRGSNSQKDCFRQNPYHPSVSHLESIPTGQGKKLLISGYWGFVRHPNYLGDILMYGSWIPFVMCYPPVIVSYLSILYLIHRSVRDNRRCKEHYGTSWDRYCQKVKYVLIPKVY